MPELTRRYVVMAMATEAPFDPSDPEGVFVLKPWKDPAALLALAAYRDTCYPELARDLDAWIDVIQAGPAVRGDVGRRNEPHVKAGNARGGPASKKGGGRRRSAKRGVRPSNSKRSTPSRRRPVAKRKKRSR